MNTKEALLLIGGLSEPSKMPCFGYSIPAKYCKTGSKLRAIAGSICSKCYALKGRYVFANVQNALERRFQSLSHPAWVEAMTAAITGKEKSGFFRWHDSGDVQSVEHLEKIVAVCQNTPHVRHWLPFRERAILSAFLAKGGVIPPNLTIRYSAAMIEGKPLVRADFIAAGVVTSTVSANYTCPAPKQGNSCGACRNCWDKSVSNVAYKAH